MAITSGSRVFRAATVRLEGVRLTLDRDDELGNDWQYFGSSFGQHVKDTLHSEEAVRVLLLTDALEEDRQVVVVVELCHVDLPVDAVEGGPVDRRDWEVAPVVKSAEVGRLNTARVLGACTGLLGGRLRLRREKGSCLPSSAETLPCVSYFI